MTGIAGTGSSCHGNWLQAMGILVAAELQVAEAVVAGLQQGRAPPHHAQLLQLQFRHCQPAELHQHLHNQPVPASPLAGRSSRSIQDSPYWAQ